MKKLGRQRQSEAAMKKKRRRRSIIALTGVTSIGATIKK